MDEFTPDKLGLFIAALVVFELRARPLLAFAAAHGLANVRATAEKVGVDPSAVTAHVTRAQEELRATDQVGALVRRLLARRAAIVAIVAAIACAILVGCVSTATLAELRRSWELYKRATVADPRYDERGRAGVEELEREVDRGFDALGVAPVQTSSEEKR